MHFSPSFEDPMKPWLLAAGIFLCVPALAANPAKPTTPTTDQDEIKGIVESFRSAVVNKDKAGFLKLFFNDSTPWIGVTSEQGLKLLRGRKTDANQPDPEKIYSQDNPTKFINGLIGNPRHFEEKFSNIHIDTDGSIGLVYFDYSFNVDGYKANWGKESWQLVRTSDGWKISAVIWSMDLNPEPPKSK
jgi:ketosteroid isomerase-like protein